MIPATVHKTILLPPIVSTNGMTQCMSFDRSGADYCVMDIIGGTNVTSTQVFSTIVVSESDTITSPTSMTAIAALSGSTATSTTYGFAIPSLSATSIGSVITLQFDLRARKKYIGLTLTASAAGGSAVIGAIAKLYRTEESPDSAALKDGVNLYDTAVCGCLAVVNA